MRMNVNLSSVLPARSKEATAIKAKRTVFESFGSMTAGDQNDNWVPDKLAAVPRSQKRVCVTRVKTYVHIYALGKMCVHCCKYPVVYETPPSLILRVQSCLFVHLFADVFFCKNCVHHNMRRCQGDPITQGVRSIPNAQSGK